MKLPDIQYRRMVYKACLALIPAVGALATSGVITAATAGVIAGILGFVGNLLADRGSKQLQTDGTLILKGSVPQQVNQGLEIIAGQIEQKINDVTDIGKNVGRVKDARDQLNEMLGNSPIGNLAQQAMDAIKIQR